MKKVRRCIIYYHNIEENIKIMREKYMKYLHLVNDKELIGKQMPKERDLEIFERWKKRWRKYMLQGIILFLL